MMIWMRLVEGMIKSTGSGPPGSADLGETDMAADVMSYFFMCWLSVILGGVLLIEQYFGRRIHCFNPVDFPEPPHAIAEYCWRHGDFATNNTETATIEFIDQSGWILQSYVYYFLRALAFFLPHTLWNSKYRPWVSAIIRGTQDVLKELEQIWLQYAEYADKAYTDYDNIVNKASPSSPSSSPEATKEAARVQKRKIDVTFQAVMAMTRDLVSITKQQICRYGRVNTFLTLRLIYTLIVIGVFVAFDFFFFATVSAYDSTDYYCPLPNGETIRCMVPMMQFLWHGALLALCCSLFILLVTLHHTFRMLGVICSSATAGCFLERVPLAGMAADLSWDSGRKRRTYKILSTFLLQNVCILHPLNFLEAFVQNLVQKGQVPQVQGQGSSSKATVLIGAKEKYPKGGKFDIGEVETMVRETEGI